MFRYEKLFHNFITWLSNSLFYFFLMIPRPNRLLCRYNYRIRKATLTKCLYKNLFIACMILTSTHWDPCWCYVVGALYWGSLCVIPDRRPEQLRRYLFAHESGPWQIKPHQSSQVFHSTAIDYRRGDSKLHELRSTRKD